VVDTDVSNAGEVQELAERAVEKFGRIDVWVNNAGVGAVGHEQVMKTNLLDTIYGSYRSGPLLPIQLAPRYIQASSLRLLHGCPLNAITFY